MNPKLLPLLIILLASVAFGLGRCTASPSESEASPSHAAIHWTCSMHPEIDEPSPGTCPICGMDLIERDEDNLGSLSESEVRLSERALAMARIRTALPVRSQGESTPSHLLGRVALDEARIETITAWTAGRIDRLRVRTTGAEVRRGQQLASLYSPEMFAAQRDLLSAKRQLDALRGGSSIAQSAARAAMEAASERLELLGMTSGAINAVLRSGEARRQVPIRSQSAGTVIERLASEGMYVQTGSPLYRVADLSRVWVLLDAYERDLPNLGLGQAVRFTSEAMPGQTFQGEVAFVDPVVDPQTRTARVRVVVQNESGELRPGTFVEAVLEVAPNDTPRALWIPRSAPLFTGRRSVVYVEREGPRGTPPFYEARSVRLGPVQGEMYPVIAGLSATERVVVHGAFTLDAELQIRGGLSMMRRADDSERGPFDEVLAAPEAFLASLSDVVEAYLALQRSLAGDSLEVTTSSAGQLLEAAARANEVAEGDPPLAEAAQNAWTRIYSRLREESAAIRDASSLELPRTRFEALSGSIQRLLSHFGNPTDETLRVAFCPMALGNAGASWVQSGDAIENSYFGDSMLRCGEFRDVVDPGAYLSAEGEREE